MELPAWVERAMTPLDGAAIAPLHYNRIVSAVIELGEIRGPRLIDSIAYLRETRASTHGESTPEQASVGEVLNALVAQLPRDRVEIMVAIATLVSLPPNDAVLLARRVNDEHR